MQRMNGFGKHRQSLALAPGLTTVYLAAKVAGGLLEGTPARINFAAVRAAVEAPSSAARRATRTAGRLAWGWWR